MEYEVMPASRGMEFGFVSRRVVADLRDVGRFKVSPPRQNSASLPQAQDRRSGRGGGGKDDGERGKGPEERGPAGPAG